MNQLNQFENRRVLIIDDNRGIHEDFRKILFPVRTAAFALGDSEEKLFGVCSPAHPAVEFQVESAYQGGEGVALVKQARESGRPFSIAFVDVRMPPGIDGVETTERIWAIDPEIQIVLCTAYSDASWEEMLERIGGNDRMVILKKPFDAIEAFQLARSLSEKWGLARQARRRMDELEDAVARRTGELAKTNRALQSEVLERKQAAEALRQSEEKFRQLTDNIGDVFWITSLDMQQIHYVSPAYEKIWGRSPEALFQNPHDWIDAILPSHRQGVVEAFSNGFAQSDIVDVEYPIARPDGETRWIHDRGFKIRDEARRVIRMGGIASDITERKRAEQALQEQARLGALEAEIGTALSRGGTIPETLRLCCEIFVKHLDAAFARIWTVNTPGDVLELQASAGLYTHIDGPHGRVPVGTFKIGLIAQERKPHLTNQVVGDPRVGDQDWARREGMVAFAGYPLVVEHRLVGVVAMFSRHPFSDETLRFLGSAARNVAMGIERKKAEAERERLAALVDSSHDFIGFADPKTAQIQYINKGGRKMCGLATDEDVTRLKISDVHPAWANELLTRLILPTAVRDGIWQGDCAFLHRDGHEIPVLMSLLARRNSKGELDIIHTISRDITERKRGEEELKFKNVILTTQSETSLDGILVVDQDQKILSKNNRFVEMWRIPSDLAAQTDDRPLLEFVTQSLADPQAFLQRVRYLYQHQQETSHEELSLKDGRIFDRYSAPMFGSDNRYYGRVWFFRDVTERRRLETQLFQSQKMETVGKLAGGVAHEFNSIMTAILGQSELILRDLPTTHPLTKSAAEINKAAERAATLTRQLLAYGRKQILQLEHLDLKKLLLGIETMLRQILGSEVDLRIIPGTGPATVRADAGQLEQVIMNMAVNARDAMPQGGKLTLETSETVLDHDSVGRHPDLKPGRYVMVAITDTGIGMTPEVKARLFEPFHTTKGIGKGTGLGLATCYGIVKQSGGHITVYSEPGRGTTFKIYLPSVPSLSAPSPVRDSSALPRGHETILLVEDDPALREMATLLLGRLGYCVLDASNGATALALAEQRGQRPIDLLFTDVVMPGMNGRELSDRIARIHPQIRVLFSSAYTENAIVHQGVLDATVALLQKPFTPSKLAVKVREVLDAEVSK